MATIKFSDSAPSEAVHFSISGVDFDLDGAGSTFESDNRDVLTTAEAHPWLEVEYPETDEQVEEEDDPNDPHEHPEVDPFSALASEEARDEHNKLSPGADDAQDTEAVDQADEPVAPAPVPDFRTNIHTTTTDGEND